MPRSRSRYRRRWLLGTGGLLVAAALGLAVMLGAVYQPVSYGTDVASVQGPVSIRAVNTDEGMIGQTYIPPQPAADGALLVSLTNAGPYPVTINSVTIIASGEPSYPTALNNQTGPATYVPTVANGMPPRLTGSSPPVAGATLPPGENILIRIPFRTPGCWDSGRSVVGSFWVTTKFLWWTHTFAVSWTPHDNLDERAIMSQLPDPNGSLCPGH